MLEQGKFEDAIAAVSRVHGLEHKSYPVAHFVLARAYAAKQQNSNAVAEYQLYVKEEPAGHGPRSRVANSLSCRYRS